MNRQETALKYFREQETVTAQRVQAGIELNRKGDAKIVFHSAGELPRDITVEFEQINHEFRFGANLFMLDEMESAEKNRIYREKFPENMNLATVPFYWRDLEPTQGQPRFAADSPKIYRRAAPDLCVEYCKEKGIEPKCHCLNYDSFLPDWLKSATVEEQKRALTKRFAQIAQRYAQDIPSFEVTNETLQKCNSKFFYEDDFLEWSYRMADRFFPGNRLIINDYNVWFTESYNNRHAYYMQIERLLREGITHLDSIGIQFHSFFSREQEADMAAQRYNPEILFQLMDLYAKLGKAEQITEMTLPAYSDRPEDEELQGELVRRLYPIFFSHPAMEAIIYWNLVDGYAHAAKPGDMTAGENKYYGGLLRFDMSEKPAYRALSDLIHKQWHTVGTAKAVDGKAFFRGFYGDYRMIVHADGKRIPVDCRLAKNAINTIVVDL